MALTLPFGAKLGFLFGFFPAFPARRDATNVDVILGSPNDYEED